mgnify:CR=1 FL=1
MLTNEKIIFIFAGYLIGSIPTGYLIGKVFKGIDIRKYGSRNIGATNVYRILGKRAAIFTLVIDFVKGFIPVILAQQFIGGISPVLVGIAAICGHSWTIFLKFRGGKGVATASGVFFALFPLPMLFSAAIFFFLVILTGYVSLGSLGGALLFPVTVWFFERSYQLTLFTILVSLLIIYNHRSNIRRLLQGKENKFLQFHKSEI